ncbi:flagellar motor switch protein FliG [Methylobacterium sp. 1030]|uniref:flagellar motor switch protein FliG n=1 Tax=Methylobacterium sp. 1030 TaxID=3156404 RepID=UPI003392B818
MAVNAVVNTPPKPMKPVEEVAAILISMSKPSASRLLKYFDAGEIRLITRAAAQLGPVTRPQLDALVERFADALSDGASLVGTAHEVQKLLEGILPTDQIADIMTDVLSHTNQSIWDRLSNGSEIALASYLMREHPQTAALILSKVRPSCAAKVMAQLPSNFSNSIMRRMLTFKPIVDDTMRMIEKTIHEDFMINVSRNAGADTHARMADIINKMERNRMEEVLDDLSKARPKSAEILKGLLFTFDDIVHLTPRARTTLFDQVPNERLILALKGTDKALRNVVLGALASRVRRIVEHELDGGEPAAQKDVLEARRAITDQALEMAARGDIELNPNEGDSTYIS